MPVDEFNMILAKYQYKSEINFVSYGYKTDTKHFFGPTKDRTLTKSGVWQKLLTGELKTTHNKGT